MAKQPKRPTRKDKIAASKLDARNARVEEAQRLKRAEGAQPARGDALAYSFEKTEPHPGQPRYTWAMVGPKGAVHIWAQTTSDEYAERFVDRYIGGVECHWPAGDEEAHHADCWLLKGPCRHDGSSLYFSDHIAPMLSPENIEGETIASYTQSELHDWCRSNIEGHCYD